MKTTSLTKSPTVWSTAWLVPVLILTLSAVPVVGGAVRLVTVALGVEVIPGNDRFLAVPLAVTLHIVSVSVFCVLGAFQVSGPLRRRNPAWHRSAGRVLVPVGVVAALSGLWLTFVYPPGELDGPALFGFRMIFGSAMAVFLGLGVAAIRRRDITAHRAWMIRALAVALGAGTQVFTHMSLSLLPDVPGFPYVPAELGRTLAMGSGWLLNLGVAEWIIRRPNSAARQMAVVPS